MSEPRRSARERALRAACAVTLGLASGALASGSLSGCAASHTPGGGDAEVPPGDAGHAEDAGHVADAGCPAWTYDNPPPTQHCCEDVGFWWEGGQCIVAVPGPFVPPAMV